MVEIRLTSYQEYLAARARQGRLSCWLEDKGRLAHLDMRVHAENGNRWRWLGCAVLAVVALTAANMTNRDRGVCE